MASLAAGVGDGDEEGPRLARGLPMNAKPKILLQGWLEKKGRQRRDWKRRWFVLTQLTEFAFVCANLIARALQQLVLGAQLVQRRQRPLRLRRIWRGGRWA